MTGIQENFLAEVDYHERQRAERDRARMRERLERDFVPFRCRVIDDMPDDLVLIIHNRNSSGDHYYRVCVGHHKTVGGIMAHLVSRPNEAWPERPPWQEFDGVQWIYPSGHGYEAWAGKEPEYQKGGGNYDVRNR